MKDLYNTLGVDKNASDEEIKAAYRAKARENHPDNPGGSTEKMQELVLAYDVLKSKTRRDRYDKTGQTEANPFDKRLQSLLQEVVVAIIERNEMTDLEQVDLMEKIRTVVRDRRAEAKKVMAAFKEQIEKYKKINSRFSADKINYVIDLNIKEMELKISYFEEDITFFEDALKVFDDYKYTFDPPPPEPEVHRGWEIRADMTQDEVSKQFEQIFSGFGFERKKKSL